jgi:hypothetical protein
MHRRRDHWSVLEFGRDIFLFEIQHLRARRMREFQPLGHSVDRDDPFGAEQECAFDRELTNRTAAPL